MSVCFSVNVSTDHQTKIKTLHLPLHTLALNIRPLSVGGRQLRAVRVQLSRLFWSPRIGSLVTTSLLGR